MKRYRNKSGVDQVAYLSLIGGIFNSKDIRQWPTTIKRGAAIVAQDETQEKILDDLVAQGVLSIDDGTPAPDAIHRTAVDLNQPAISPTPVFRNASVHEFCIHNQDGMIVEVILPNAEVVGDFYLQFQRPRGPLQLMNPPPPQRETVYDPFSTKSN